MFIRLCKAVLLVWMTDLPWGMDATVGAGHASGGIYWTLWSGIVTGIVGLCCVESSRLLWVTSETVRVVIVWLLVVWCLWEPGGVWGRCVWGLSAWWGEAWGGEGGGVVELGVHCGLLGEGRGGGDVVADVVAWIVVHGNVFWPRALLGRLWRGVKAVHVRWSLVLLVGGRGLAWILRHFDRWSVDGIEGRFRLVE